MAQTKARRSSSSSRSNGSSASKSSKARSGASRSSNGRSGSGRSTNASRSKSSAKSSSSQRASTARDRTSQVRDTVVNAASKAKTPLIAGGAALAGLAGGAVLARNGATKGALGRSRGRGSNLSMPSLPKPSLPKVGTDSASVAKALGTAAKEVGKAGFKAGELATEVRRVREQMKGDS